jgi:hypothetical protein
MITASRIFLEMGVIEDMNASYMNPPGIIYKLLVCLNGITMNSNKQRLFIQLIVGSRYDGLGLKCI